MTDNSAPLYHPTVKQTVPRYGAFVPRGTLNAICAGVLALATVAGCSSAAARREKILAGPTRGLPIRVVPFDTTDMDSDINLELTDFGDDEKFGRRIAQRIVFRLKRRDYNAKLDKDAVPSSDYILIRGKVESVDQGSRAARWATMGIAGGAEVAVSGSVVCGDEEMGEFRLVCRTHSAGLFGGSGESRVNACVEDFGAHVAGMVMKGKYRYDE